MSNQYDNFWKFHNKDNMDKHAVALIEWQNNRIKQLEELLIEYGRHQPGCPAQYDKKYRCRCGWDREKKQALKGK